MEDRLLIAKRLADRHLESDDDVQEVYLVEESNYENRSEEPIKLLEVVAGTPEVGLEPIGFPPSAERGNLGVIIIEISSREFERFGGSTMSFGERSWRVSKRLASRPAAA